MGGLTEAMVRESVSMVALRLEQGMFVHCGRSWVPQGAELFCGSSIQLSVSWEG